MILFLSSQMGLRRKFLILITLMFIPILGVLFATGYNQVRHAKEKSGDDVKHIISMFVDEQKDLTIQTRDFLKILTHVPSVREINPPECNALLQALHKQTPQYSTIVVANAEGMIDCCAIPLKKTINVNDRSWFKRIKENRDFVIDRFIISRSANKASLPFAYPILDEKGALKGAVGAAFNLEYYHTVFNKKLIPKDSTIFLTDQNGSILYQSSNSGNTSGKPVSELLGRSIPGKGEPSTPFAATGKDGISRLYWYEWFWIGQESNVVCLLVGISKQTMFADIKNSLLANLVFLVCLGLISLITAWFIWEKLIQQPIDSLVRKTNEIKQGRWDFTREKQQSGELLLLSKAFDDMAENLSQKEQERDKALLEVKKELAEKRKTENELKESEERLNILFEQAADPIYIIDLEGRFVGVNNAACREIGYTEKELIGMTVTEIDKKYAEAESLEKIFDKLLPGHSYTFSSEHRRKDGSVFPVEITSSRIETPDGPTVMGIARNVTERREFEKQVQQAQKIESIGNLAGGIAHDFNNILFPIIGISEMLYEDLLKESEEQKLAEEIFKAGKRGSDLVKQILAFSRQSEHSMAPTRIQSILDESLKLLRSTIPSDIKIRQDIQQDCGLIMADTTQIHQIIMNLVTNAYHAVETCRGDISVVLKEILIREADLPGSTLEAGMHAVLTISDTGTGISAEHLDRIFDPYFTTKEQGKGTGLGLSVVHGIVREHRGTIKVESQAANGTTFTIYFPLMDKTRVQVPFEREEVNPGGDEKILLVDDEKAVARLGKQILERLGYTVTALYSSLEALNMFKTSPGDYDLVVTDMTMPDMTGDLLAKELKRLRPDIPVIICTGFSERINQEKAESIGIKGFLMKPIVRSEFAEIVRKVLDETKGTAAVTTDPV